jgi:hypothetical protein
MADPVVLLINLVHKHSHNYNFISFKMHSCSILYTLSLFLSQAFAGHHAGSKSYIAFSWSQNSLRKLEADGGQKRHVSYCAANHNVAVVLIPNVPALNTASDNVELNLASQLNAIPAPSSAN